MTLPLSIHKEETIGIKEEVLRKLLEFSEALMKGDYSRRVITDFSDDIITRISNNFNRFADKMQLDPTGFELDQDKTVNTFMEVIGSYTNLDFKQKLPISENGTIWDAVATGINMLGDELEHSTASRQELEREQERLKVAMLQAEEANKAKSRFLANMSHEIRTPLNGILGLTEIMMGEEVSPDHYQYLKLVRDSGKNLSRLINDILDFSKIESGNLQLEHINFNFAEVITSGILPYKFLAEQKGLNLTFHIDDSIPKEVVGDPTRISQIVNNLIGNAIKFTEQGKVEITFNQEKDENDGITIKGIVKDTGVGIPQGAEEKIFQSFSQADETITRKFGGTGLGLSIVRNLLQLMSGDISIQSPANLIENNGSAFVFTMKLKKAVLKLNASSPSEGVNKNVIDKSLRVLVVDDNPVNLLVAKKMLQKFGAEVTTAPGGNEAIELVKNHKYDMVLMDVQMPEMNGIDATVEIRKLNFTKPIIALSANAYPEDVQTSKNAGMDDHLHKPYTESQLFHKISEFI